VILVDANILLYASFRAFPNHTKAHQWLIDVLRSGASVGIPWESINAFLRLSTNARVLSEPLSSVQAWSQVQAWLDLNNVWAPAPTEDHAAVMNKLLQDPSIVANLISDAHLAAIAIEHGLTLMSCDSDFARFPGLLWQNPLLTK
jgi:uncharacterized protein